MKIKVVLAVAAVLITAAWSLRAQKYDGLIDKTVALVGNSMIQLSQVEGEVQMMQFQGYVSDRNLRCEVLENMMVSKLFYTQAQLDSLFFPAIKRTCFVIILTINYLLLDHVLYSSRKSSYVGIVKAFRGVAGHGKSMGGRAGPGRYPALQDAAPAVV